MTEQYKPGDDLLTELEDNTPDFLIQDKWWEADISTNWLDVSKDYKKPQYMLRINGIECFPLGGLQGITGQAGSGKTQTMSMLIAAVLGDRSHNMEYCLLDENEQPVERRKVLYVDTEMEEGNTQLVNCRVCSMLNWDYKTPHDNEENDKVVKYLRLRDELTAADRWRKILKAIYEMREDLRFVIVDGLIDVIGDFNDNKECQETIFKTMAVSEHYRIALCLVLHQNPNSDKMVGHAGSFLERKATDIFMTKKEKDEFTGKVTFTISHKKARGEDVPDLKFRVNKDIRSFGVAEVIDRTETETLQDNEDRELDLIMQKYVPRPGSISQTELQKAIKNGEHIGSTKAFNWIKKAEAAMIIEKAINGKFVYIGYKEIPKTEEIIFTENNNPEEF